MKPRQKSQTATKAATRKRQAAVKVLAALAHEGRLDLVRVLIQAGPEGLPAVELARQAGTNNSTMSAQLLVLANAGLVESQRRGRFIIYSAKYSAMQSLLGYLLQDCCCGSSAICTPLLESLAS